MRRCGLESGAKRKDRAKRDETNRSPIWLGGQLCPIAPSFPSSASHFFSVLPFFSLVFFSFLCHTLRFPYPFWLMSLGIDRIVISTLPLW